MKRQPIANDYCYHVFNRSIAKFVIFNGGDDYSRFRDIMTFYRFADLNYKYSDFLKLSLMIQKAVVQKIKSSSSLLVDIVAFCLMPTHIHLILKQIADHGISIYMARILDSYSRYFNIKYKRKGPLWEGRFKHVLIDSDEQLLHLTRYLHLNATSAGLVEKPEDWKFSSYGEYLSESAEGICNFKDLLDIKPSKYRKFVNDRVAYQKEISKIKNLLIEDYSG